MLHGPILMETNNIIYGLACPFAGSIHYIGQSTQGIGRPMMHVTQRSHSDVVNEWVDGLQQLGQVPRICILEILASPDDLNSAEKKWIQKYKNDGAMLLNIVHHGSVVIRMQPMMTERHHPLIEISNFVKSRRSIMGLTQPQLAEKSGVGLRFLRNLEQCRKPNMDTSCIQKILDQLGGRLTVKC